MKRLALAILIEAILPACLGLGLAGCVAVKVGRGALRDFVGQ